MRKKTVCIEMITIAALATLASAPGTAVSQSRPQQPAAAQQGAQQQTEDKATVETFAVALLEVKKIQSEYTEKIQVAKEPEVATLLQREAQTEMIKAVQNKGLTVNQYNNLAQKMDADPQFRGEVERVMKKQ